MWHTEHFVLFDSIFGIFCGRILHKSNQEYVMLGVQFETMSDKIIFHLRDVQLID